MASRFAAQSEPAARTCSGVGFVPVPAEPGTTLSWPGGAVAFGGGAGGGAPAGGAAVGRYARTALGAASLTIHCSMGGRPASGWAAYSSCATVSPSSSRSPARISARSPVSLAVVDRSVPSSASRPATAAAAVRAASRSARALARSLAVVASCSFAAFVLAISSSRRVFGIHPSCSCWHFSHLAPIVCLLCLAQ